MLAVTGDVHGHPRAPIEHSTALLMEALAGVRVRGPRLAVLGNHDPASMVGMLERAGFDVLVNRSILLRRGDEACASPDWTTSTASTPRRRWPRSATTRASSASPWCIRPRLPTMPTTAGYALYLCGHTHGGQICLPGGRPLVTHLKRCRHAASGLWRQGRMVGYTSRGLGVSDLPMRFNTRGEVVVITLRRSTS